MNGYLFRSTMYMNKFFFWSGSSFTWHSRITRETNLNSSQPLSPASIHLNIRTFKHSNQSLWAEYELHEIFYILQWFSLEIWEILIYFYPSCMDHLSFLSAHQHLLIWNRLVIQAFIAIQSISLLVYMKSN